MTVQVSWGHPVRVQEYFAHLVPPEEEISEEELFRYTRYRWLYETNFSHMIKWIDSI